jgi:hypothetical protein
MIVRSQICSSAHHVSVFESLEARTLLAVGVLDTIIFGNTLSESGHSFASNSTQVIAGNLAQSARQELPLSPLAVNGGDMTFIMAVDPVKRNYFTVKLWGGDDTDQGKGRLYLYIPSGGVDYQVGYRHEGDYSPLSVAAGTPPLPGRFFYSTTLLPLSMTQGKSSLILKIQSTGELYGLGSGGPPTGNYQFNMDTASRGIYRAYTHTQPMIDASDETQGSAPSTTTRNTNTEAGTIGPSGTYTVGINNWISNKLGAAITTFTTTDVELLARSYSVSQLSNGYHISAVINKVMAVIDGFTSDWYTNPTHVSSSNAYGADGGNEVWGGRFGPLGWAIHLLANQLAPSLDTVVNYGSVGGNKTRREAWGDMLQASRDNGRFNRDSRYLTNQTLIADSNIYKANAGMLAIGDAQAFTETAARRYIKEAIGILPWVGSDLSNGGYSYKYGTNYYQVTPDGLTKEWAYPGSYGEMQYFAAWFYKQTGDTAFRDQAIKILKARAPFRRPTIETVGANRYRSMERIGLLAWRGVREADGYFSDDITYGDAGGWSQGMSVAGATLDPTAVGYAKQMLNDGQYFAQLVADSRYYGGSFDARFEMEVWDDYNAVKNAPDSGIRLPMSDGQPDFAWADEDDAIVAIKHGNERLWIEGLWQAKEGVNGAGRFYRSLPTYDQYGTLEIGEQMQYSGSYYVRPNLIDKEEPTAGQYNPPSPPTQAYLGEHLPVGGDLSGHDNGPHAGRAEFYSMRFGNYLIGINDSPRSYELKTPVGFTSASDLVSGQMKSGIVNVNARTTVALYLNDAVDTSPVPGAPLLVSASGVATQINLAWSVASGATSYNVKRSLTSGGPYSTIASNIATASFTDTSVRRAADYFYVITSANGDGESANSGEALASAGLPAPWASADIGTSAPVLPGSASITPDGFLLTSSGTGIGGTSDGFFFACLPVTGDVSIQARVARVDTVGSDLAGVMIRESLNPDSKMAAISIEDGGNLRLNRRTTSGGASATSGSINGTFFAPGWIKLERIGNTFNGYTSTDGVSWGSPFTSQTISMNALVYVGMAAASRTNLQTIAAQFTGVQITPGVQVTGASYPIDQRPDTLKFSFNTNLNLSTLTTDDLTLARVGGDTVPAVQSVQWDAATKTATFFLTTGAPANGFYRATIPAYGITAIAGQPLNSSYTFQYVCLSGDVNQDAIVNSLDFSVLATHFGMSGQAWSSGDFNYDGTVNALDFNAIASDFGTDISASLASPSPNAQALPSLFSSDRVTPENLSTVI